MEEEIVFIPRRVGKYYTPLEKTSKKTKYYIPLEERTEEVIMFEPRRSSIKAPSPSVLPVPLFDVRSRTKSKTPIREIPEEFLGVGTYGCTFYPAKSCEPGHRQIENEVAKVFYEKESYEEEKEENSKIRALDPEGKFTLLSNLENNSCKIGRNLYNLDKCGDSERWGPEQDYYQIIYRMGGKDLETIMQDETNNLFKHEDKDLLFSYAKYFNAFKPILQGFASESWKSSGSAHTDIKGMNITMNDRGKANLIDFGLLTNCSKLYSVKDVASRRRPGLFYIASDAKVPMDGDYMFWPPEFKTYFDIITKLEKVRNDGGVINYLNILNLLDIIKTRLEGSRDFDFQIQLIKNIRINPSVFMKFYENQGLNYLISELFEKVDIDPRFEDANEILDLDNRYHIKQLLAMYKRVIEQFILDLDENQERLGIRPTEPVSLLDILKPLTKIFVDNCEKIDVYMLGLAMLSGLILAYYKNKLVIDDRFNKSMEYIGHLIDFNMFERYNSEQALNGLNNLIEKLNEIENVDLSTIRGGGFIRKIKFIYGINGKKQIKKIKNKSNKNKKQKQTKRKNKYLNKNKKYKKSLKSK